MAQQMTNKQRDEALDMFRRLADKTGCISLEGMTAALKDARCPVPSDAALLQVLYKMEHSMNPSTRRATALLARPMPRVCLSDFTEWAAEEVLAEARSRPYEDLARSEQGLVLAETGNRLWQLLLMCRRKQMMQDFEKGGAQRRALTELHFLVRNDPLAPRCRVRSMPGVAAFNCSSPTSPYRTSLPGRTPPRRSSCGARRSSCGVRRSSCGQFSIPPWATAEPHNGWSDTTSPTVPRHKLVCKRASASRVLQQQPQASSSSSSSSAAAAAAAHLSISSSKDTCKGVSNAEDRTDTPFRTCAFVLPQPHEAEDHSEEPDMLYMMAVVARRRQPVRLPFRRTLSSPGHFEAFKPRSAVAMAEASLPRPEAPQQLPAMAAGQETEAASTSLVTTRNRPAIPKPKLGPIHRAPQRAKTCAVLGSKGLLDGQALPASAELKLQGIGTADGLLFTLQHPLCQPAQPISCMKTSRRKCHRKRHHHHRQHQRQNHQHHHMQRHHHHPSEQQPQQPVQQRQQQTQEQADFDMGIVLQVGNAVTVCDIMPQSPAIPVAASVVERSDAKYPSTAGSALCSARSSNNGSSSSSSDSSDSYGSSSSSRSGSASKIRSNSSSVTAGSWSRSTSCRGPKQHSVTQEPSFRLLDQNSQEDALLHKLPSLQVQISKPAGEADVFDVHKQRSDSFDSRSSLTVRLSHNPHKSVVLQVLQTSTSSQQLHATTAPAASSPAATSPAVRVRPSTAVRSSPLLSDMHGLSPEEASSMCKSTSVATATGTLTPGAQIIRPQLAYSRHMSRNAASTSPTSHHYPSDPMLRPLQASPELASSPQHTHLPSPSPQQAPAPPLSPHSMTSSPLPHRPHSVQSKHDAFPVIAACRKARSPSSPAMLTQTTKSAALQLLLAAEVDRGRAPVYHAALQQANKAQRACLASLSVLQELQLLPYFAPPGIAAASNAPASVPCQQHWAGAHECSPMTKRHANKAGCPLTPVAGQRMHASRCSTPPHQWQSRLRVGTRTPHSSLQPSKVPFLHGKKTTIVLDVQSPPQCDPVLAQLPAWLQHKLWRLKHSRDNDADCNNASRASTPILPGAAGPACKTLDIAAPDMVTMSGLTNKEDRQHHPQVAPQDCVGDMDALDAEVASCLGHFAATETNCDWVCGPSPSSGQVQHQYTAGTPQPEPVAYVAHNAEHLAADVLPLYRPESHSSAPPRQRMCSTAASPACRSPHKQTDAVTSRHGSSTTWTTHHVLSSLCTPMSDTTVGDSQQLVSPAAMQLCERVNACSTVQRHELGMGGCTWSAPAQDRQVHVRLNKTALQRMMARHTRPGEDMQPYQTRLLAAAHMPSVLALDKLQAALSPS